MHTLSRLAQVDRPAAPADPAAQPPIDRDFDEFLDLFEDLRGLVPASFFLLFKIARVLKTPDGKLTNQLQGFYDICRSADRMAQTTQAKTTRFSREVPILTGHDPQFGQRRITGVEEIGSVKPVDVAIEDFTELLRKAEERQLDIRVLLKSNEKKAEDELAPIRDGGSRQMGNAAEQKLYLLLDRSFSMWEQHRFLYAKVLAIEFLRRKKGTGARLFYRAFDYETYELQRVVGKADFDNLIRHLLFIEPGGKGTDIQLALMTAIQDIRFDGMLDKAEIMLITDGCDHIEVDRVKEALGTDIKIHMLKIGRDSPEPSPSELKDMIEKDHSIAGLDRDQVKDLHKRHLMHQWREVTTTLIEVDDFGTNDLNFGNEEIDFALAAAQKVLATIDTADGSAVETAFRKASFVEGFLELLLDSAAGSPAVAARRGEIAVMREKLNDFKVRLAGKHMMLAGLLAAKDLKFVTDKKLRREAKKANLTMDDLARLQESDTLHLKLKVGLAGGPGGPEREGLSLWKLLRMIARSTVDAVGGWLTGSKTVEIEVDDETGEPIEPPPKDKKKKKDKKKAEAEEPPKE